MPNVSIHWFKQQAILIPAPMCPEKEDGVSRRCLLSWDSTSWAYPRSTSMEERGGRREGEKEKGRRKGGRKGGREESSEEGMGVHAQCKLLLTFKSSECVCRHAQRGPQSGQETVLCRLVCGPEPQHRVTVAHLKEWTVTDTHWQTKSLSTVSTYQARHE